MRKTTSSFVKSLLLVTALVSSNLLSASEYDFTAAKSILSGYIDEGKLAGGVLLVIKDGEEVLFHAAGKRDIEADLPMEKDTLFRIASQTKAITSAGIMILHDRGKIEFTDPVSKYIPAFKSTTVLEVNEDGTTKVVPAKREITIHDLLTHTAGINYGTRAVEEPWTAAGLRGWYYADKDQTIGEALKPLPSLPQIGQPGEAWVYGHNTDILGHIIEIISGQNLSAFLTEEILSPLGMSDTFFYVPADKASRLAAVYNRTESGQIKRGDEVDNTDTPSRSQGHYVSGPKKAYAGGAGLVSTAKDYSKFLQMLLNDGSYNGKQILSPEAVKAMSEDQVPYVTFQKWDGFGYGFGVLQGGEEDGELAGETVQYGWSGAYHSYYYIRPHDGLIVVYLTQLIPATGLNDWVEIESVIKIALGLKSWF